MSILAEAYFRDEAAALAKLEQIVWPQGPVCPHCAASDRIGRVVGKGARPGLKYCCHCRKQFRATIGTAFEHSHVPIHKWLQACYLLTAGETAISAHQLHLRLGVSNETATQIVRRIAAIARRAAPAWPSGAPEADDPPQTNAAPRVRWARRPGGLDWRSVAVAQGDPSPWATAPAGATRQYLSFLKVAQELGCRDDPAAFDRTLSGSARQMSPAARWQPPATATRGERAAPPRPRAASAR